MNPIISREEEVELSRVPKSELPQNDKKNHDHFPKNISSPSPSTAPTSALRPKIERQRPRKKEKSLAATSIMSLVGLKNLFFQKTITPIPNRAGSNYPTSPFVDWNSRQPLLQSPTISSNPNTPTSHTHHHDLSSADNTDVESQTSSIQGCEKSYQKKAFRVDPRVISDATIGLSDGLTVPFALTAGLSALGNTKVVIYGGFAELIAGAISMGLGGYLGAKSEAFVSPPLHFR